MPLFPLLLLFLFPLSTSCMDPPYQTLKNENPLKAPTISPRGSAARYFVLVFRWLAVPGSCRQGSARI